MNILSDSSDKVTPFMNLFWQQKKLFQCNSSTSVRYHPMMIRFCLSLYSKSRSAYEELRNSNVLLLQRTRTLTDYKNFIRPKSGVRKQVFDNLVKKTSSYFDVHRYGAALFDEIYDKHTGEIIGILT